MLIQTRRTRRGFILLGMTGDVSISSGSTVFVSGWGTEIYNTEGPAAWQLSDPSRIYVPLWARWAKLLIHAEWAESALGYRYVAGFHLGGDLYSPNQHAPPPTDAGQAGNLGGTGPWMMVNRSLPFQQSVFRMRVRQTSGTPLNLQATTGTYFGMEFASRLPKYS